MVIAVKVIPNAQKTELRGTMADGTLKIAVAAAPEKGRANEELVRFFARRFSIPRDRVIITRGLTSKRKIIKIINFSN